MADNNLVIVESPAKAKTIKKFLGKDYTVQASMGHVRDLPKSQFGVDIESNFRPKFITIRGKGKVLKKLRRAVKKSNRVYLATDPDREGEAISWHLIQALKMDDEGENRIEFNEITKPAVQRAIKTPRRIDRRLVDAQKARRILDRIVGYRLSPLLWNKVRKGLSAGRVQSVAVRLICDREQEIRDFEPEEYWTITALLERRNGSRVNGTGPLETELKKYRDRKVKIPDQQTADRIVAALSGSEYRVERVRKKKRYRKPRAPFTTSTLQQQASNQLGFSTKKTMYLAQQLYEGVDVGSEGSVGLLTYIRTDSTRISEQAQGESRSYILSHYDERYLKNRGYAAGGEAQDAHEAIRPTSVQRTPEKIRSDLSRDQYRLYRLIWTRFLSSQMSPAVLDTMNIDIRAGDYTLRASGSKLRFPGFLAVDRESRKRLSEKELPELDEGEVLRLKRLEPEQHFTKPPSRYSEASLVKELEQQGVGRPSTYSTIVSTIQQRGYVEQEERRFRPTELGETVNSLLVNHFPDITNVEFTAELEDRLDRIEEGREEWDGILQDFYATFSRRLEEAQQNMEEVEIEDEETEQVCEKCGQNMVIKHGRYGKFLACPGFPDCRNTRPLLKKIGVSCPECDDGEVVERRSRKGRRFFGCSSYPDCNFTSWDRPVEKRCPECGGVLVEKRNKKGSYLRCINKDCELKKVSAEN